MDHHDEHSVCIMVPCYNAADYIAQALQSAVAQTRPAQQIIVINDGCTDDSAAVVRRFMAEHPAAPIELIEQANAGEAAARNAGMAACRTRWIANLDADDWWHEQKIEKQVAAAKQADDQTVLIHTSGYKVFPDGRMTETPTEGARKRVGWCTEALIGPGAMGHPSIMVRRDALEKIGGYDPAFKRACDLDMYLRLSTVGKFAFLPDRLVYYRAHENQLSAVPVEQIAEHHRAVEKLLRLHPEKLDEIGRDRVNEQLAAHAAVKLESLYWQRRLPEFRQLLRMVAEKRLDSEAIQQWRKRARWPNWLIHAKDRLTGDRRRA